jgi:hypothetical protein
MDFSPHLESMTCWSAGSLKYFSHGTAEAVGSEWDVLAAQKLIALTGLSKQMRPDLDTPR